MTLSMARTSAPHSATSQFYINLKYNRPLDRKYSQDNFGYCVFGKVIKGEEVVDQIAKVKTGRVKGNGDVPLEPITLKRAMILEGAAAAPAADTPKDSPQKDK
jgi:cyclophilin family peptidyl-prolyl cis-trans isomerase